MIHAGHLQQSSPIQARRYWLSATVAIDSAASNTVDGSVLIEFECVQSTGVLRLITERASMTVATMNPPVLT